MLRFVIINIVVDFFFVFFSVLWQGNNNDPLMFASRTKPTITPRTLFAGLGVQCPHKLNRKTIMTSFIFNNPPPTFVASFLDIKPWRETIKLAFMTVHLSPLHGQSPNLPPLLLLGESKHTKNSSSLGLVAFLK